jgi:biuret amidohydrolase
LIFPGFGRFCSQVGEQMTPDGTTALVVIDVQKGELLGESVTGIPVMPGAAERHGRIRELIDAARGGGVPVVFIQEVHKRSGIDFGRELDGAEGPHCIEGEAATDLADGLDPTPDEYLIRKRRYSAFFATELDLVLRSLGAETLILVGALTDVCVHYTAVDAHQHDYRFRVVEDCVGGSSQEAHEAALNAMAYLQRGAVVRSADVFEQLRPRVTAA